MSNLLQLAVASHYNLLADMQYIPNPKIKPEDVNLGNPDVNMTVVNIFNTVYFLAGAIAVLVLVFAGLMYITSSGDPGKTKNARNLILGAAVGLIFISLAAAITAFVTSNIG